MKKLVGRRLGQLGVVQALEFGEPRGGMDHVGGLVSAAAMGYRREIGRIGLHQQPVHRHVAGDGAHLFGVLEGQDA